MNRMDHMLFHLRTWSYQMRIVVNVKIMQTRVYPFYQIWKNDAQTFKANSY